MNKSSGWIKLHRQIRENWIWEDAEMLKAWLDLLLMVNHQDKKIKFNGEIITIKRGEKLTSIMKLSDRWGWSRKRVMRFLDLLESDEMVTTKRTTNGTTIKVHNYAEYQGFWSAYGTTNDTTNDTTSDTPYDTPSDTQTIINKNVLNNSNNEGEGSGPRSYLPPTFNDVKRYCKENNYHIDIPMFMSYYAARDWELSRGKKMTNWKGAVDAWYYRGSANRREEERHGVGLASTGLNEQEQEQALIRSREISETKQVPDGPGRGSKFKGGAAAELRRRQRNNEV